MTDEKTNDHRRTGERPADARPADGLESSSRTPCGDCRGALSDYLERSLTPVRAKEVRDHLAVCDGCRRELADLKTTLRVLATHHAEEPAPDLASRAAALVIADRRGDTSGAGTPVRAQRQARASGGGRAVRAAPRPGGGRWVAVAAAALLLFALGFVAGRTNANVATKTAGPTPAESEARAEIARLETELREVRRELGDRNTTLARDVAELRQKAAAERRRSEERDRAHETHERELRAELALARQQTGEALARADDTLEQLGEAAAERDRLAAELGRLEEQLVAARTRQRGGAPQPVKLARAERSEPEPAASVVRREGSLELRLRGTREECIASLFALAEDTTDPEVADLALVSLEEQLGRAARSPARPRAETGAFAAWLDRQVGRDSGPHAPSTDTTRAERLRRLREHWQRR